MKKLLKILTDIRPDMTFSGEEELIEGRILDSLDIVSLVTDINSEYGISLGAKDISEENFGTARDIAELIRRRGGEIT